MIIKSMPLKFFCWPTLQIRRYATAIEIISETIGVSIFKGKAK